MLNEMNLKVDCALNGRIALECVTKRLKLKQPLYQLILLDFSMPELDGPSTAIKVRHFCKSYRPQRPVPIMACFSAYDNVYNKKKALDSGIDFF